MTLSTKNFKIDGKFLPINEELARSWYAKKYLPTTAYILAIRSILKRPNEPLTIPNVKEFCSCWGITTSSFYRAITTLAHNGDITWETTGSVIIKTTEKVVPFVGLDSHERDTDSHERDTDSHERDTDSHERDTDSHERDTGINNDRARADHSNIQIETDLSLRYEQSERGRGEAIAQEAKPVSPSQAIGDSVQQQEQKKVPPSAPSVDQFFGQSRRPIAIPVTPTFQGPWGVGHTPDLEEFEEYLTNEGIRLKKRSPGDYAFKIIDTIAKGGPHRKWKEFQEWKAKGAIAASSSTPHSWNTDPRKDAWLAEFKRTNKNRFLLNGQNYVDEERYAFFQHALEEGWIS